MHAADDSSYHRTIINKNQGTIFFRRMELCDEGKRKKLKTLSLVLLDSNM